MHKTISIPNLLGGISSQPPSVRENNKATNIENAVPSVVEGLIRRPPTEFIGGLTKSNGSLCALSGTETPFFHFIDRDASEKYLLTIFNDGTYNIYDLVNSTRKTTYGLAFPSVAESTSRKAITIGDVTFVSSAEETVTFKSGAVSTAIPAVYDKAGLVFIKQANFNRKHTIKVTSNGVTYVCSHISRSTSIKNAGTGYTNGTPTVTLTYVSGTKPREGAVKAKVTIVGGSVTKVQVTEDADSWENDWLKESVFSVPGANTTAAQIQFDTRLDGEMGTTFVAEVLTEGENSGYIGHPGGLDAIPDIDARQVNSTIHLTSTIHNFTVVVEDDFGDGGSSFIRDEVQSFEDLPITAPNNYTVKVFLSPESDFDDYYVKFSAENQDFSNGLWVETTKPGILIELDPEKMPKILIRQSDLTFYLKNADGTTPGTSVPAGANYDSYSWAKRLVGDDFSNPPPTFVDSQISNLAYYQSRVVFVSGENIIMSEVSEFFNFFRTSVLDYFDSDPIDAASSLSKVGKITFVTPFNRDLIAFSPTNQMLFIGNEVLSPKTANLSSIGDYENLSVFCAPTPSANSVFFPYKNGNFCGIREFIPAVNVDGSYASVDLSGEVASLIPGVPNNISSTTTENIVTIVSSGNLYLYKYFNSGQNRILSSWFKFVFPDSRRPFARVLHTFFIDSDMYLVLARYRTENSSFLTIERIKMGTGAMNFDEANKPWHVRLDSRSYDIKGTYNANTDRTTFKLPVPLDYAASKYLVCTEDGEILNVVDGSTLIESPAPPTIPATNATIQVNGNYANTSIYVGLKYKTEYEFSPIYLKKTTPGAANNVSILGGRTQIKYLNLKFEGTSYFNARIRIQDLNVPETGYTEFVHPYTGENLGISLIGQTNLSGGVFRIPVYARNEKVRIIIESESPAPFKLLSAEAEVEYNQLNSIDREG